MAPKTSTVDNADLEHTEGGATTRDSMDAGVPMTPGDARESIGPEDAFGAGPKRGDYSGRIVSGPSMETRIIPEAERVPNGPIYELVEQGPRASLVGDEPGKGGVTTAEAVAEQDLAVRQSLGQVAEPVAEAPAEGSSSSSSSSS